MKTYIHLFFCCLLFLACFAWSSESFRVEVKDEQPTNNDILGLRMRIINNSGQQYNNVQVKYYLKKQPTDNLVLDLFYLEGMSAQLEQIDNTTAVLKVGISVLGQGTIPNADGISVGIRRSGWGSLHKENQPDYPGSVFAEAVTYEVFAGDNQIVGLQLPQIDPPPETPKLRFIGIRPETADTVSTWVQLQNYGDTPISLNGVKIKDASGEIYPLGDLTIDAKSTLRVCNGPVSNCTSDSAVTSISELSFGKVGEFVLYQDSVPLDYIVWGARGNFADSLQAENRIIDPEQFFNTSEDPVLGPVSPYYKGDFFRAIIKADNDSIISWDKFREKMVGLPLNQWPFAEQFAFNDSSSFYKRSGEATVLAWNSAAKARSYKVTILNANDKSLVLHEYTDKLNLSVFLEPGDYLWIVEPKDFDVAEFEQGHTNEDSNIPYDFYGSFKVLVLDANHQPLKKLDIDALAARKDSYMLDLKWGERIIDAEWDKPHNTSGYWDQFGNRRFSDPKHYDWDAEESSRCWAVVTAELNHYYFGNLTQDEIKFYYNNLRLDKNNQPIPFSNPILDAFPHGNKGEGRFDGNQLLAWALNINNSDIEWYDQNYMAYHVPRGTFDLKQKIVDELNQEHPIIVKNNNHFMVLNAYTIIDGTYVFRFLNTDNNGTIAWTTVGNTFEQIFIIKKLKDPSNKARLSVLYEDSNNNGIMDQKEIKDADNDGLIDFDEYYRFGTYHYNWDHDTNKDGKLDFEEYCQFAAASREYNTDYDLDDIPDKIEIMSYTIREKYSETSSKFTDYGVQNEVFTDIDGDGIRAEKDYDSDDDGKSDGEEDINKDGIKDVNETDVYIKDNNIPLQQNTPNVTLYALSELSYNDGVVCNNESTPTGFCNIASAAENSNGGFAVKVGARATVGDIYSKGKVLLRSDTRVKGGIYLVENSSVDDIYLQNGSTIDGGISMLTEESWNNNYMPPDYNLVDYSNQSNYQFVAESWNTYELTPGYYSFLKAEANATLRIPPGTFYIGTIQLDPGSKIEFTNPGQETVMHINGDFTWRAKTNHNAEDYATIAQGFKIIQHIHGTKMYIDNMVAGNIIAPNAEVIIAQSRKVFYGKIYADKISVHQYAKLYHVDFNPIQAPQNNLTVASIGGF